MTDTPGLDPQAKVCPADGPARPRIGESIGPSVPHPWEYTGVWPAPFLSGFHRSPPLTPAQALGESGAGIAWAGFPQPPCSGLRVSVPPWFRKRQMTPPGDRRRQPCGRSSSASSIAPFVPDAPGTPSSCGMAVFWVLGFGLGRWGGSGLRVSVRLPFSVFRRLVRRLPSGDRRGRLSYRGMRPVGPTAPGGPGPGTDRRERRSYGSEVPRGSARGRAFAPRGPAVDSGALGRSEANGWRI